MTAQALRPFTILVAALGGEGGGVLADWLVEAALHEGYPVQRTSIPGVSQRTGATTYYVEIFPAASMGRLPVMALIPSPGGIDLMAASELVEAGRAMQNAFVTADRTTLVASTHRIYATSEKMVPGDGRYAAEKIISAAPQLSQRAILFDMLGLAQEAGTVINAVLFGAMAGSGVLPLSVAACEAAIRSGGKGAEASLRGFRLGFAKAAGTAAPLMKQDSGASSAAAPASERVHQEFPGVLHELLDRAVARLIDYQDAAYAGHFLDRVRQILAVDREAQGGADGFQLTGEAARLLSLWMSYEDVIRVADLKTRGSRFARVRSEALATTGQLVVIVDYLKPGIEEIADILPPGLAQPLRKWARGRPLAFGLQLKTSSIAGFLSLRLLALLKPWRRKSSRFIREQATIERWLGALKRLGFASLDRELALEIAQCGRLVRGYGETQRRGRQALEKIFTTLLENEAAASKGLVHLKQALRGATTAALADPDCAPPLVAAASVKGKTVIWLKAG